MFNVNICIILFIVLVTACSNQVKLTNTGGRIEPAVAYFEKPSGWKRGSNSSKRQKWFLFEDSELNLFLWNYRYIQLHQNIGDID